MKLQSGFDFYTICLIFTRLQGRKWRLLLKGDNFKFKLKKTWKYIICYFASQKERFILKKIWTVMKKWDT